MFLDSNFQKKGDISMKFDRDVKYMRKEYSQTTIA